jgi:hypothetical protein
MPALSVRIQGHYIKHDKSIVCLEEGITQMLMMMEQMLMASIQSKVIV